MKNWLEFNYHFSDRYTKKKKNYDNTIYTFDIETTSYYILDNKIYSAFDYLKLTDDEKEKCIFQSCMYIWMFSINDTVYYGRTFEELEIFLDKIFFYNEDKKIVYVHNLSFEFQFLKSYFKFNNVVARKAHKVMKCLLDKYNIEFRCSYYLSNVKLELLPKIFKLNVKKLVGNLDYSKIRNSKTILSDEELSYCENDCLVLYEYIKKELETYEYLDKIPLTSTGKVRRELKNKISTNMSYKYKVRRSYNDNPNIYNLLVSCFQGGYTHSNYYYTDTIIKDVSSFDFNSSYPYVLVAYKYPMTGFKECFIKNEKQMISNFAYILIVKFKNISSKYFNNFISGSKCINVKKGKYDNGRLISAEEIEIVLTDVDFRFILKSHIYESYEIIKSYYAIYDFLPKEYIEFILEKYVGKTKLKNLEGYEVEYAKTKNSFNALYGMTVTNNIRDEVVFDGENWQELELSDNDIIKKLKKEKMEGFLSFSWGVWCTAHERNNLLENLIKLDDYVIYSDTDSLKLRNGFNKKVIDDYNKSVIDRLKKVSEILKIDYDKFCPEDSKGIKHPLGIFENDGEYYEFITQGAKKYCYTQIKENIKDSDYVIDKIDNKFKTLSITVAGVPKTGNKCLKDINDFRDNLVFDFKNTNKLLLAYNDNQCVVNLIDYQGNADTVKQKSGACLFPTTYVLGKSLEYAELISDESSKRAIYKGK